MLKCYTWILAQKSQSDTRKTTKWIRRSAQGLPFIWFLLQMVVKAENCTIRFTQCIMPCTITQSRVVVCSSGNTGIPEQDFHSMVVFKTGPDFFPFHSSKIQNTYSWKLQNRICFVHYAMRHHAKPRGCMLKCLALGILGCSRKMVLSYSKYVRTMRK